MNNQINREETLHRLFEHNFKVARYCRKTMEAVVDASLHYYFQNLASRRSKFALELAEEIVYYGGKRPYFTFNSYESRWKELTDENKMRFLKKAVKLNKSSLIKYKDALGQINDGSCREILLRHKAFIENSIFELKSLKKLLKYNMETGSKETAAS